MDEYFNLELEEVPPGVKYTQKTEYDMTGVEMFRAGHEPLESKPKIGRKAENKVSKRTWRPGPAPAKPDNECTPEELNRRERRRASNRKAAQSARDRRVKKQSELELQINQLLEEKKMYAEEKAQWADRESKLLAQIKRKEDELREARGQIHELEHRILPPNQLDFLNSASPISGLSNEEVNDILGLDEYMSTDEKKNMNKMSDLL